LIEIFLISSILGQQAWKHQA